MESGKRIIPGKEDRFTTEYTEEEQNRQRVYVPCIPRVPWWKMMNVVIPMDTESAYKSGAVMELWVNGEPTGRTVTIGKTGEARRLDF